MKSKKNNTIYSSAQLCQKSTFVVSSNIIQVLRSSLIFAVMIVAALSATAESVISFPRDRASSVAVVIRDLSTGKDIVSQNPHKAMLPASTMKCVTTAAALLAGLDTAYFETEVYIEGEIVNGVLKGNLVVNGSGDPTIESAQFPANSGFVGKIAKAVQGAGIKQIEGEIQVDSSNFPDNGPCDRWELSDLKYEYGAGLYALNYRDNRVGSKAMEFPSEVFGEALENKLLAEGISVSWQSLDSIAEQSKVLLVHHSPYGAKILENLMKRSDNLFAEGMLRMLAPGQSLSSAIARERSLLTSYGLNFDIADIYDGSGLSRNNRITARFMADLLTLMASQKDKAKTYLSFFPLVGKEGTVKPFLKGSALQEKLALKTGSLNGVHCYAGYKIDSAGTPTHVVVILVNDFFCKRGEVRESIASFLKRQF